MEAVPLDDFSAVTTDEPTFCVRVWRRPAVSGMAWSTEDWLVMGAEDVRAVLDWATARLGAEDRLEVHVLSTSADHIRIAGGPPDEVTEVVEVPMRTEG